MGCEVSTSEKVEPKDLKANLDNKSGEIVENDQRRRTTTDILFLLIQATAFIVLIALLLYCVYYGNIYRIINGYDSCGNICGKENVIHDVNPNNKSKSSMCEQQNMKNRPYILVFRPDGKNSYKASNEYANGESENYRSAVPAVLNNTIQRACLQNCSIFPHFRQLLNKCVLEKSKTVADTFLGKSGIKNFFEEVSEDFELGWQEFLYLCLLSLVFSVIIMVLLRFLVGIVVWLLLIGVGLACLIGTICLWFMWKKSKDNIDQPEYLASDVESRTTSSYLAFAIIATVITVCVALLILVMRKRVQLVIQLFKEAGRAVSAMPLLLLLPLLTFTCVVITIACWIYFTLWIESAGHKKEIYENFYIYEKDFWIAFTRWYNIFFALWLLQFIIGCQHVVAAGAISSWYFTRNKDNLQSPMFGGFYNLLRYHLGSVSFGSLLIALVQFIRILLTLLQTFLKTHNGRCVEYCTKCCHCCLYCLEKILKYIVRNAYIEIAIHGYPFCRAGKEAYKILATNALRVTAINSVGDFILFLGKVFVIMATVLVGTELIQKKEGILHAWVLLTLSALFAYFISHCFLSVYEMAIDTVFICFCVDCCENDGISKPYFMSRGLMEYVENSKNVILKSPKAGQAWEPTTVSSTVN